MKSFSIVALLRPAGDGTTATVTKNVCSVGRLLTRAIASVIVPSFSLKVYSALSKPIARPGFRISLHYAH